MSFYRTDHKNKVIRKRVTFKAPEDEIVRVEQSHKDIVEINNIVKRHGIDLLQKVAAMQTFEYDDNPNNDFQEVMNAVIKASNSFEAIPSAIRKQFDNNPAKFMDFIYNPDNAEKMVEMGLAKPPPPKTEPIEVRITNSESTVDSPVAQTPE